ncbi:unnamed protein product [Cochlearia groenlandica]
MEGNSSKNPTEKHGDSLANNANDWRSQQEPNLRKIVLFKIVEKFKTYFPDRSQDEINGVAFKFEDKVYATSISKDDYLCRITQKVLMMDQRYKEVQTNNLQSGSAVNGTDTLDSGAQAMNQVQQSLPTSLPYTQTHTSQHWLPQNIQINHNIHVSSSVPITVSAAQNLNTQVGEGAHHPNLLTGSQRQQTLPQQQQPHGSTYMVQQYQMSQQLPKENIGHGTLRSPSIQQHAQPSQQQHHLLRQPIQQQLAHQKSPSFTQSLALSSLPSRSQQNSQFLPRSHFPTQLVHPIHQQQMDVSSREQNHLLNVPNTQQNHLTPRQNNGEQQRAFSVSSPHKNNTASFQAMGQQNNDFQRRSSHGSNASPLPSQQQQNMPGSSLLGTQGQDMGQSQPMMFQQYQPQHPIQQKPDNRILQQHLDDTKRFQAATPSHQIQNMADQKNQPHQLQRASPANPSSSQDSTGKTVHASVLSWQEETYQKIKALREKHVSVLILMLRKVTDKLSETDSLPQQNTQQREGTERFRAIKSSVRQLILFLNVSLGNITEMHRDKFSQIEEHILKICKTQTRPMQQQEGGPVNVSQSQDNDQMTSRLVPNHQNVAASSVSALTTSQTAMPSMFQTRPKMEPKDGNVNIIPSLKQSPVSNQQAVHSNISPVQPSVFQDKQFHHIQMPQQLLQRQQQQPLQSKQQLQIPKNEVNDVKVRPRTNTKAGLIQRQFPKPLVSPQARVSSFSPSALSPRIHHHSSPPKVNKTEALSQSVISPFVAPSPVPGDPQKPITVESPPVSHANQIQTEAQNPSSVGGNHEQSPELITEGPINRLVKAIQSASPKALAESVSAMSSIISLSDRRAGSVHSIEGFRAHVAADLSGMKNSRLQQGETYPANKRFKRTITALPLNVVSQTDSFKQFCSLESEVDSTASSGLKDNKLEPGLSLLQEIKEINGRFIETMVKICNEDVYPREVAPGGTIVTCSYAPVALCATLKAYYESGHISQIQPLRVLLPAGYPYSSPILLEKTSFHARYDDLSAGARTRFSLAMREVSEPISLKDIAQTWNDCARATIIEYAERHGGGTFSSKYGHWETFLRAL